MRESRNKAVALCPSLTKVEITTQKALNDENLLELLQVKNVCYLKISEALTNDISFYEGVVTCLFAILRFGTRSSQLFFLTFLRLHFI
jgi:hypothetical protein